MTEIGERIISEERERRGGWRPVGHGHGHGHGGRPTPATGRRRRAEDDRERVRLSEILGV